MIAHYIRMTFERPKRSVYYVPPTTEELKYARTADLLSGIELEERVTYERDGLITVETGLYQSMDDAINAANELRNAIQSTDIYSYRKVSRWACTSFTFHTKEDK